MKLIFNGIHDLQIFDLISNNELGSIKEEGEIQSSDISSDGELIAVGTDTIKVYSASSC